MYAHFLRNRNLFYSYFTVTKILPPLTSNIVKKKKLFKYTIFKEIKKKIIECSFKITILFNISFTKSILENIINRYLQ